MLTQILPQLITRSQVIESLANLRKEWEEASGGESLVNEKARVGYILADFANGLGLTSEEKLKVLGPELYEELSDILITPPNRNGGN